MSSVADAQGAAELARVLESVTSEINLLVECLKKHQPSAALLDIVCQVQAELDKGQAHCVAFHMGMLPGGRE